MQIETFVVRKPARAYSFDRKVYDRAARTRRCQPLGFGGCFGGAAHVATGVTPSGDYRTYFTGVLQALQPNLGLIYGGTLLDGGGAGPVLTLTGTLTGSPVPIWVKATSGGARGTWTYTVYYDGTGATPAMAGTSGSTGIALTGAGTGLTLNIAAGTATLNNTWKATCSQLTDLSGNGVHATQATAAAQPTITAGLNSRAGLSFDGLTQWLIYTLALNAPSITPTFYWLVYRMLGANHSSNSVILSDSIGTGMLLYQLLGSTNTIQYNAVSSNTAITAAGTWGRCEALFNNNTTDYIKFGSASPVTGVSSGNLTPGSSRALGALPAGSNLGNFELLALITLNNLPNSTRLSNASAAVTSEYAGGVAV